MRAQQVLHLPRANDRLKAPINDGDCFIRDWLTFKSCHEGTCTEGTHKDFVRFYRVDRKIMCDDHAISAGCRTLQSTRLRANQRSKFHRMIRVKHTRGNFEGELGRASNAKTVKAGICVRHDNVG